MKLKLLRNRTLLMVYVLFIIVTIITIIYATRDTFTHKTKYDMKDFSYGWVSDNKSANLNELYKYDVVKKKIPILEEDREILINFKSVNANILVGDKYVYKHKELNKHLYGHTEGSYFVTINLLKEDSNKDLTIEVLAPYDDGGRINKIYIGDSLDMNLYFIRKHLLGGLVSVAVILVGLILILVSIPLIFVKKMGHKMLYIGTFAFMVGSFMLFDSKIFQLVFGRAYYFHMISEILMLLIMLPLMLYIGHTYRKSSNRIIVNSLSILALLNFVINYLLNLFGILDYHSSIKITHGTYILGIIYIIYVCIKSFVIGDKKELRHTFGLLLVCLFVIIDILTIHYGVSVESSLFTRMGALLFLIIEAVGYIFEYYRRYERENKVDFLSKLAYRDGLTDLLNRTSFIEEMDRLEKEKTGAIIVFDVNDLKVINDTYGHGEGDCLIIDAANIIRDNLDKHGKCYRIGGDEFVFLTHISNRTEIKNLIKSIEKDITRINKNSTKEYNIAIAMGFEIVTDKIDFNKAFKNADKKMYEDKKKKKSKS